MNKETKEAVTKGLEYYNIIESDNEFYRKSGSIVYKIVGKDNQEYSFHLYEGLDEEDISVSVELPLRFLEDLLRFTDLSLAAPIKNINNEIITSYNLNNKRYVCTLQHWLKGKIIKKEKRQCKTYYQYKDRRNNQ